MAVHAVGCTPWSLELQAAEVYLVRHSIDSSDPFLRFIQGSHVSGHSSFLWRTFFLRSRFLQILRTLPECTLRGAES